MKQTDLILSRLVHQLFEFTDGDDSFADGMRLEPPVETPENNPLPGVNPAAIKGVVDPSVGAPPVTGSAQGGGVGGLIPSHGGGVASGVPESNPLPGVNPADIKAVSSPAPAGGNPDVEAQGNSAAPQTATGYPRARAFVDAEMAKNSQVPSSGNPDVEAQGNSVAPETATGKPSASAFVNSYMKQNPTPSEQSFMDKAQSTWNGLTTAQKAGVGLAAAGVPLAAGIAYAARRRKNNQQLGLR